MADLDACLNQLISDQESRQKVLDAAKAILAQRDSAHPEEPSAEPPSSTGSGSGAELSQLLSSLLARQAAEQTDSPPALQSAPSDASQSEPPSSPPLMQALPMLMAALSGKGELLDSHRLDLLRAMQPYLRESRAGSIDRAVRMANLTKAAASAMHLLGR